MSFNGNKLQGKICKFKKKTKKRLKKSKKAFKGLKGTGFGRRLL